MYGSSKLFDSSIPFQHTLISTASGSKLTAVAKGCSALCFGIGKPVVSLDRILHVLQLSEDFLPVSQLCGAGYEVEFDSNKCQISRLRSVLGEGKRCGKVYCIPVTKVNCEEAQTASEEHSNTDTVSSKQSIELWHGRLAHG